MADQLDATTAVLDYVRMVSLRDDQVQLELRELTAQLPGGTSMQVMAEQAQLLGLLVGLTRADTVLEVGTYTGYSALAMARALPPGGRVTTCDINPKWVDVARPFWERAGVADRIDVVLGDAEESLRRLVAERPASYGLVFVDGDKTTYPACYGLAYELTCPGGLIVFDNTLYFGRVVDEHTTDPATVAVRELNQLLLDDDRIDLSLLPMADGITLARKR